VDTLHVDNKRIPLGENKDVEWTSIGETTDKVERQSEIGYTCKIRVNIEG